MASQLYLENDNYIVIRGLRNAVTGAFITNAIFTGVLKDATKKVIAGASSISFDYTAGSEGDYRGLVAASVNLTGLTIAYATITCSNYGIRFDDVPLQMLRREG